jgi:hypothetical protein
MHQRICRNKEARSLKIRPRGSLQITGNTLLRVQALSARFPPKTRYKPATRRVTSVQQDALRVCNNTPYERAIDAPRACNTTHYMRVIDKLLCATTLRRVRIRRSSRYGGVTRRSSRYEGVTRRSSRHGEVYKRSSRHWGVTRRSSRYGGVDTCSSRYGTGTNRPFQQDLSITTNTLSARQALPAGVPTSTIRFLTALTVRIRVRAVKIRG